MAAERLPEKRGWLMFTASVTSSAALWRTVGDEDMGADLGLLLGEKPESRFYRCRRSHTGGRGCRGRIGTVLIHA
jgi:hypothetical protein